MQNKTVSEINSNLSSCEIELVDYATLNSIANGNYFSSGGVWVAYNKYFVQISIRLYFNVTFTAGNNYGFGVPASTHWSKVYAERIITTSNGVRILLAIQSTRNVFNLLPGAQISAGDNIREDFFCLGR